jgi:hypothetical protein
LFEDLGGPDHGQVGCFADPEDLFLQFRESFVAAFDGEVAPGDHDADAGSSHGGEQQLGQVSERRRGLDLDQDSGVVVGEGVELVQEVLDVGGGADEGRWSPVSLSSPDQRLRTVGSGSVTLRWYHG